MAHDRAALAAKLSSMGVWLLALLVPTLFCGGLYSCSVPPREATEAFFDALRRTKQPPYALESTDAADASRALAVMQNSTGFWTLNFHVGTSSSASRACLFIRVSLPEGGRWMDVALEETRDGWRVRDLSFERDCESSKRGDLRLH